MDPELVIYAALLLAIPLIAVGILLILFGGTIRAHLRTSKRLTQLERSHARPEAFEALRKEMGTHLEGRRPALVDAMEVRLRRAAIKATPMRILAIVGAIALGLFAVLTLFTEAGLGLRVALPPVVAAVLVNMWIARRIKARVTAIEDALPDAVELMVRSLRVGHPFASAVQIVAREVEGPLGEEMAIVADETSYGRDTGEALSEMAERVGLQDLRFLAVAVTIQRQAGGNLAEVLEGLSKVIRSRFRLFRRVKAITAEAKFSGVFLSAFPLVAVVGINVIKPDYYDAVRETAYFMPAAAIVAAFLVGNLLVMRRLVDIKV